MSEDPTKFVFDSSRIQWNTPEDEAAFLASGDEPDTHLLIVAAEDLVALWRSPKIKGLPRWERNNAIDDAKLRLENAVDGLQNKYPFDLVDTVARAIVNCHSRNEHHIDFDGYIEEGKKQDYDGELMREIVEARRQEARAAITAVLNTLGTLGGNSVQIIKWLRPKHL